MHHDPRAPTRPFVHWLVPLLAGIAATAAAARLDNPLIPIGSAEVFLAFGLGALLRSAPFRIGVLLVFPAMAYMLIVHSRSWHGVVGTVLFSTLFALFNGLFACAGAQWATEIRLRRRDRGRPPG